MYRYRKKNRRPQLSALESREISMAIELNLFENKGKIESNQGEVAQHQDHQKAQEIHKDDMFSF